MTCMGRQGRGADFYEDDEDPKAIRAAFDRGHFGVTAPPRHAATLQVVGATVAAVPGSRLPRVTGSTGFGIRATVNG
jgi:hypothetical protein